jgi:hypothetical protein
MQQVNRRDVGRPIIPKEHGAWAVLYGAFLAGVGVAGRVTLPSIFLLGAVTFLAFANGPLVLLLRSTANRPATGERRRAALWLVIYGIGALLCAAPLLTHYRMTFLVPFGMAAACFVGLRAFLVRENDDRTLAGEVIGAVGLTLVGPTAHAVAALVLFFVSGVFYVRARIRLTLAQRKGAPTVSRRARWSCLAYHVLLLFLVPALAAAGVVPWAILLAFAPALWRAAAGMRRRDTTLNLKRLGWSEVGLTAAFVLLITLIL